jgi:EmrB/QacA subfamily drug resistance transporter
MTSHASTATNEPARLRRTDPGHAAHRWWILAVIGLAQLMVVLDATIVNIALPSAQHDLHFSNDDRQWIITAYSLAFGSLLLFSGRIADLVGRKIVFLVGVLGFAGSSAFAGAANNFTMLVVGRSLQGVFGALLAPAALSLLNITFTEPKERGKAFGIYGAVSGTGGAIGLLLGGVLTQHFSWRWTLYVNVIFAVLAFLGGMVLLKSVARDRGARLDWFGVLLVSAGLFGIVYGLSHADSDGWSSPQTYGYAGGGLLLVLLFLLWQTRAAQPLLPLRIPGDRTRGASLIAIGASALGMFGVFLFLTYYMQATLGYDPVKTGLAFLPMVGALVLSAQIATNLTGPRIGPKVIVPFGMLLAAAGMVWLTRIGLDTSYATHVLPPLLVFGVGLGHVMPPAMNAATAGVGPRDAGVTSASVNTMQQVGGAIGTALLNTLAVQAASDYVSGHRPTSPAGMPHVRALAQLHSYTTAFWWSAAIFAGGAVLTVFIYRRRGAEQARAAALQAAAAEQGPSLAKPEPEPVAQPEAAPAPEPEAVPEPAGPSLTGVVRDTAGGVLAGAALTLISSAGEQLARGRSGTDGGYRLHAPGPGPYVLITAADGRRPQAATVHVAGDSLTHDVVLAGGGGLRGLVRGEADEQPVAGALVVVTGGDGDVVASTTSDDAGAFAVPQLPAGSYTLAVNAASYRPTARLVDLDGHDDGQTVTIDLTSGVRFHGTVRDRARRMPVHAAHVTLVDASGAIVRTALTDVDGGYSFADLVPGDYRLVATGYPAKTTAITLDGRTDEKHDVELAHPDQ